MRTGPICETQFKSREHLFSEALFYLNMEFGSMDLFDSEEESEPVVDKALVDRLSYTPRQGY